MVAAKPLPPQEYLCAIFADEWKTVSWRVKKAGIVNVGDKATHMLNGYLSVQVDGRTLLVHRVLFKMRHGYEPPYIDHADGDKTNNTDSNLRPCTMQQNTWNSKVYKRSTTGVKNVQTCGRTGKYRVHFKIGPKRHYGGLYESLDEAARVADEMRKRLHGEFSREASDASA